MRREREREETAQDLDCSKLKVLTLDLRDKSMEKCVVLLGI